MDNDDDEVMGNYIRMTHNNQTRMMIGSDKEDNEEDKNEDYEWQQGPQTTNQLQGRQ